MRRAAGRGRSEPAAELRADAPHSRPDPFGPVAHPADDARTCAGGGGSGRGAPRTPAGADPSSQERSERAVEADLGVAGQGPGRVPCELVRTLACCPRGTDLGDRHRRRRGRSAPAAVRSLAPTTPTSGPGSRGDEIPHSLAIQRGAIRVMRAQVGREVFVEDLLDRRPSPGDRDGIEPRQEVEVFGAFDVEVEGQVDVRSSGHRHLDAAVGGPPRGPGRGGRRSSIRSLIDV